MNNQQLKNLSDVELMIYDMRDWNNREVCDWTRQQAVHVFEEELDARALALKCVEVHESLAGWVGVGPDRVTRLYPSQKVAQKAVAAAVREFLGITQVRRRADRLL